MAAQWDTLRLYTPAKYDGLPGLPFPGRPWMYPRKDEVADYLEAYAARSSSRSGPASGSSGSSRVRTATSCTPMTAGGSMADNVVVATGTFGRTPSLPDFAVDLDPAIRQLHSSEYRRPGQLKDGPVLVVGASHSGTDIAYEVAPVAPDDPVRPGPRTDPGPARTARRPASRPGACVHGPPPDHQEDADRPPGDGGDPLPRRPDDPGEARGPASSGTWNGSVPRRRASSDGAPVLDDGRWSRSPNVVWCTGFRQVFDWLDVPVIGADGWPREYRGVAEGAPGLFFCGLAFQYAFSSMMMAGVGRDAAFVAEKIAVRSRAGTRALRADAPERPRVSSKKE